ncbi:MAG: GNAT family N-acetyltransferase [Variibacter sp.]
MTTYRLDTMLSPRSIAVVGASPREQSVGRRILVNLKRAGFAGEIRLVNPRYPDIEGIKCIRSIDELPQTDLVVVACPPAAVPDTIAAAGAHDCSGAIIITSGLGQGAGSLAEATLEAARKHGMRLIGPNCLGLQVPRLRLDASFAARMADAGELALISQSGAIAAGMVEWAAQRGIGFSGVVSLGNQIDVDFGDLLDYFAEDKATRALVLYIESISDAPKFLSAARAIARIKPVIVIKAGRHAEGAAAARTHTGALAGSDAAYDAAFRRVGLIRALDLDELFDAAETLGHIRPFSGRRLAILTNGGGMGVLAVDRLLDLGGTLASLSKETQQRLDENLPPAWSRTNPVDIIGDAGADRYTVAIEALLDDPANDAVLVIHVPTALASATGAAEAIASSVRRHQNRRYPAKPVFGVWLGDRGEAENRLNAAGIPHFQSESDAARGFMQLVRYRERLNALMATPSRLPADFSPDQCRAQATISNAIKEGRVWLDPIEVTEVLSCYAIPCASVSLARTPAEAAALAKPLLASGPVALKISSQDIAHKSDVGGVQLNLAGERAVREAAEEILARVRAAKPRAHIAGLTVHPMIVRPKATELIAGVASDATFGPVIIFGAGGTAVELTNDTSLALPPLDLALAHDLMSRTRVFRLLQGYRNVPPADIEAVALTLVKLARLAIDLPEVSELDLNPLLADAHGVISLDARIAVANPPAGWRDRPRFSIRPYPQEWERHVVGRDGAQLLVRPVRPEDEPLYVPFLSQVSREDLRLRFFAPAKEFSHEFIARFTQIDYARAMAFLIIDEASGEMLGVGRLHVKTHGDSAEFAVLVRSDLKGQGLGWLLMQTLIEYARAEGIVELLGEVMAENVTMLRMCGELGFSVVNADSDASIKLVTLRL